MPEEKLYVITVQVAVSEANKDKVRDLITALLSSNKGFIKSAYYGIRDARPVIEIESGKI